MPKLARIRFLFYLLIFGILLSRSYYVVANMYLDLANTQYAKAVLQSPLDRTQTGTLCESSEYLFNRVIGLPSNPERALVGMGRIYAQRQDYTAAIMILTKALDIRANNNVVRFQLGNTYLAMGDIDQAIQEWRKANAAPYFFNLGNRFRDATPRDFDMALDNYQLAITIDPSFVDPYYAEASVLWGMGRGEQAAIPIEHALAIDQVASARRSFYQGQLHLLQKQPNAAVFDFQEVLRLKSDYSQGKLFLGTALFEAKRFEEAVSIFEQIVAGDPKDVWSYVYLVRIFRALNQPDRASYWYEKAMIIDPGVGVYLGQ